ncbi:MAG TPA: hypothetical protein VLJ39_13345 [Tepidisphaeraceae bacterium]|nr:hypothetical protein [Tepidisphaeraceae bacterium]
MRKILALTLLAAVASAFVMPALAKVPEPSVYPIAWELDFKHGAPKRVVVGQDAYWYITYTVTNNTGQEQVWRPDFQMLTNDGKVVKSDHEIPPPVFDKIKSLEGNKLLQRATQVAGPLRQGVDQAKDGVAIWPETTPRMGSFKIFVGGLSGEFVILKDDDGKEVKDADGLPVMLRKTLELDYQIWGDEFYPGRDDVHEMGHKWIMR